MLEFIRTYCLQKPQVSEHFPFDEQTLVFKVLDKVFALIDVIEPESINLKTKPDEVEELRAEYDYILPGFHMNKKHWNTVLLNTGIRNNHLCQLIDESYSLVVAKMPKKQKEQLTNPKD